MAFSSSVAVRELPLFPLPEVVLFPGCRLPLHIFEFRYRIMMNTILQSDGRFGVLMFDPSSGAVASVGGCAEVIHHHRMADDRMKIVTLGQQRFRVLDFVREKPYYVGLVEWIEDQPTDQDLKPMASEVEQLLRDFIHLAAKLTDQDIKLPEAVPTLPVELSYWVAGYLSNNIYGVAQEMQALLEMQNTLSRLEREAEILTSVRSHLAARTALKDALSE